MSYTPPNLPLDVTWEGTDPYVAPELPLDVTWEDEVVGVPVPFNLAAEDITQDSARLTWEWNP